MVGMPLNQLNKKGCPPPYSDQISLRNLMLVHHWISLETRKRQTLSHIVQITLSVPREKPVCTDCLSYIHTYTETSTDLENTINLLDRSSFQLQNNFFLYS